MGLFERKRSVAALDAKALESIKLELNELLSIAASYDNVIARQQKMYISLDGRIRGDLLAFVLYLAGVTKGIDLREVLAVNQIFDIDLSHFDFQLFAKEVGSKSFERSVPPSILLLKELGNELQRAQTLTSDGSVSTAFEDVDGMSVLARELCLDLINAYALIGSAFISANGQITERESEDLIRYLTMMTHAIFGPDAELPEGPARRTLEAHRRLFRKDPRVV